MVSDAAAAIPSYMSLTCRLRLLGGDPVPSRRPSVCGAPCRLTEGSWAELRFHGRPVGQLCADASPPTPGSVMSLSRQGEDDRRGMGPGTSPVFGGHQLLVPTGIGAEHRPHPRPCEVREQATGRTSDEQEHDANANGRHGLQYASRSHTGARQRQESDRTVGRNQRQITGKAMARAPIDQQGRQLSPEATARAQGEGTRPEMGGGHQVIATGAPQTREAGR